jgi:hypothetical protein
MEQDYQNRKSQLLFTFLDDSYLKQLGKQTKKKGSLIIGSRAVTRTNNENISKPNRLKNLFLTQVKHLFEIDEKIFQYFSATIENNEHKVDFNLIILIRFLFLITSSDSTSSAASAWSSPWAAEEGEAGGATGERGLTGREDARAPYIQQIHKILSNFIFWPTMIDNTTSASTSHSTSATTTSRIASFMGFGESSTSTFEHCFWSENHIFMFLSSACLLYERCVSQNIPCLVTEKEVNLLMIYLTAHVESQSMYETLSHVYLPYTLASLLNLYDFSSNTEIRNLSLILINNIIEQLLVCTNSDGVSTFTPSTRQFNKTQTQPWGHNVNSLIFLLTGQPPPLSMDNISTSRVKPTPLLDFLLTSTWAPSAEIFSRSYEMRGYRQQVVCHPTAAIREIYSKHCGAYEISPLELVPFYWY